MTSDVQGAHPGAHVHVGTVAGHAPSDAIIIPDAHMLFTGDFKRAGVDLVVSGDGREIVLHDYFKGEKRAALASPDGAHLTGDIINALTGHTQFAQADGSASVAQVIGHVTKLTGTATAIRNGVSIILNQGDNVNKGDVVASGSDSTLGITFIDGTVFGLASNAKMVLNEMVYDPNGSDNKSLISLVAGTISFVAGATAKHGDMKVDTPVATMGIRGTAVLVEIDFTVPANGSAPPAKFQVLVEPDGTTGSYILFDKTTLTPIATVNQAGTQTIVNGQGGVNFLSSAQLSADAQKIITDVFALKFSDLNNSNTKQAVNFTDTIVPQNFFVKTLGGDPVGVIVQTANASERTGDASKGAGPASRDHIPGAPKVGTDDGIVKETVLTTGSGAVDAVSGRIVYSDINPGDVPTAKTTFDSFTYQNAAHADVTATLTAAQLAAIRAVEAPLTVVQDPAGINVGTAVWTYSVADRSFDFLAAGEVLTLTYKARVDNNFAPSNEYTEVTFKITITGTNDKPVITTSPAQIDFAGGKSTPGGTLTAHVPTSGTLTFTDPDLTDHHTVSTALSKVALDGVNVGAVAPAPLAMFQTALTASILADSTDSGTGTISWKLADFPVYFADFIPKGETLTLTYTVTVTDSQGATSTQNIVVTITGTDTPAVVWIATEKPGAPAGGLWSDGANWETGTVPAAGDDAIIITNQLLGLTPSYPVTINSAAVAKTVTMNDYGTSAPVLINNSTLTVGNTFDLSVDSVVKNFGTITIGGLLEVQDHSSLQNSGTLNLLAGAEFKGQSSITNAATGKIEISSGTLNVLVDIANSGEIKVDSGALLTLASGTIDGGKITNAGTIEITGTAGITNDALANHQLTVDSGQTLTIDGSTITGGAITNTGAALNVNSGKTATLNNVTVTGGAITNTGATVKVAAGKTATLNDVIVTGGSIADGGTINVAAGKTLTLNGVALDGGNIGNAGTIEVSGTSSITNDALANHQLTVDSGQTLTIDGSTITGGAVANTGATLKVNSGKTATLNDVTVTGGTVTDGGTINVGSGKTLTLNGVALAGGFVTNSGTVNATGSSSISNDSFTNNGTLNALINGTLELTNTSVANGLGTIAIASGATLDLDGGTIITGGALTNSGTIQIETNSGTTLNGVTVTGGGAINVDLVTVPATLILEGGTSITGGTLANGTVGTVEIAGAAGATLNDVVVTNVGRLKVDTASQLVLLNGTTIAGGSVALSTGGLLKTYGAGIEINSAIINNGTIEINNGTLKVSASISGTGSVKIDGGATFELNGSDSQAVAFNGANAVFRIDGTSFGGTITGFAATDQIDLRSIAFDATTTATFVGGVLTILHGGSSIAMTMVGDYSHAHLVGTGDATHTLITFNAVDDAPVFAVTSATGAIAERLATTGSSAVDTVGGTLHFSDVDLLDRPTASITSQSVSWIAADHSTNLGTPSHLTDIENALKLTQVGNTNNGTVGWTYSIADGTLDFLAEGETITLTSTITLNDGEGKSATATVTVTITGHNDAPVITVANPAAVTEGNTGAPDPVTVSVADHVTISDVDSSDVHTPYVANTLAFDHSTGPAPTNGSLAGLFTIDTVHGTVTYDKAAFDYLAGGEQVVATFKFDASSGPDTVHETITVTINGINDAPVFTGSAADTSYDATGAAVSIVSGVAVSDVDNANFHGGTLTATVTAGVHDGDTLSVVNNDHISLVGNEVMFDADGAQGAGVAVDIGTITNDGINSLTFSLNTNADKAAVAALTESIEFSNAKSDAIAGTRTVAFTLHDGGGTDNGGHDSATFTADIDVTNHTESAHGPVILTDQFSVTENQDENGTTTISGLHVSDPDGTDGLTVTASTDAEQSSVTSASQSGFTYDPSSHQPDTDAVTFNVTDSFGATDTVHFIFNQGGTGPDVTLTGTSGKDVIFATGNNDTLTGGAGADQFVFRPSDHVNSDIITDFAPGQDHIDLRAFSAVNSSNVDAWLMQNASQTNSGDVLITLDGNDTLTLKSVALANLHAGDFIVHPVGGIA